MLEINNDNTVDIFKMNERIKDLWDYEENTCTPDRVLIRKTGDIYRTVKVSLKCKKGHRWVRSFGVKKSNRFIGCNKCDSSILSVGDNDLKSQRPDLLKYFSYDLNKLKPEEICINTKIRLWWRHLGCGHTYNLRISNQVKKKNKDRIECPICSFRILKTGVNDLKTLYPDLIDNYWSNQNTLNPEKVMPETQKVAFWHCPNGEDHISKIHIDYKTKNVKACRVCSGAELLIGFNDPLTKNPNLKNEWHPTLNGATTLYDFTYSGNESKKQRWWICKNNTNHVWSANTLLRVKGGGNCPSCFGQKSLLEDEVFLWLRTSFPSIIFVQNERKVLDNRQELDIWIPELSTGVEINGEYWHSEIRDPKNKILHDKKESNSKKNSVKLIVLWEEFWQEDSDKVKRDLSKYINTGYISDNYTYQYRRNNPSKRFPVET